MMVSPQKISLSFVSVFESLKERSEIQRERELNVDTDGPIFVNLLKYGISRD